jgi:hypothetical protein
MRSWDPRASTLRNMKKKTKNSVSSRSATTGELTRISIGLSKQVNFPPGSAAALHGRNIADVWNYLVPRYESKVLGVVVIHLVWQPVYAKMVEEISPKRAANRRAGYLDMKEIDRAKKKFQRKGEASIRFGAEKKGHGYSGERGDFCLVGGVIRGKNLSLFYRSLELIGGFAYDLTLIASLEKLLEVHFQTVTIYATKAFTFALKGNSNEKLFPKLQRIFRE